MRGQIIDAIFAEMETNDDIFFLTADMGINLVEKFEEKVGPILTEEERNADIDTVGGLVFTLAGRVPARGEVISHPSGYEFRILDSDPRRIRRLRARRMDPIDAPPDGESPKPA